MNLYIYAYIAPLPSIASSKQVYTRGRIKSPPNFFLLQNALTHMRESLNYLFRAMIHAKVIQISFQ